MPTIPILIVAYDVPKTGTTGAVGWRLGESESPLGLTSPCLPLSDAVLNWLTFNVDVSGTGSIAPNPPTANTAGLGQYRYEPATYSYPAGDTSNGNYRRMSGRYYINSTQYTHEIYSSYFAGYTLPVSMTSLTAIVADPLAATPLVDLQFGFRTGDLYINDVLYYRSFDRAQFQANGIIYQDDNLAATILYEYWSQQRHVTTGQLDTFTIIDRRLNGTVQFPLTSEPVYYRLGTSYGEWTRWVRLKWVPGGDLVVSAEDDTLTLDARGIYVIGGQIKSGDGLRYTFSDGGIEQPYTTDAALTGYDITGNTIEDEAILTVYLQATSGSGCIADFVAETTVEKNNRQLGSLIDCIGNLYTAVNEGEGVRVSRFKRKIGARELLALVADAKDASLSINTRGELALGYTQRSTAAFKILRSTDSGEEFS